MPAADLALAAVRARDPELRLLEEVVIGILAEFNLEGTRREEGTGVWLGEKKIASISVNLRAVGSGETAEKMPGRLLYANGQRVEPQTLQPRER